MLFGMESRSCQGSPRRCTCQPWEEERSCLHCPREPCPSSGRDGGCGAKWGAWGLMCVEFPLPDLHTNYLPVGKSSFTFIKKQTPPYCWKCRQSKKAERKKMKLTCNLTSQIMRVNIYQVLAVCPSPCSKASHRLSILPAAGEVGSMIMPLF